MRVLYIIPTDIYTEPWAIRALKISEELCGFGHQVTLVYFRNQSKRGAAPLILHTPAPRIDFKEIAIWNVWNDTFSPRMFLSMLSSIRERARSANIIHCQKALPWGALPAILAARLENKPLHYDWDDNETAIAAEFAPRLLTAEIALYERILPRLANTISVSTSGLRRKLLACGFPGERIFDAPVGADLVDYNPRLRGESVKQQWGLREKVILYMGQIEWGSYAELLVDAFPHISAKVKDVSLLVVGGGEKLDALKKRASTLGIEDGIVFTGYVSREAVPDYVACCDVAVACFPDNEITRYKSPLKIAEYMAAGKPVVASAVGDVPAMVGEGGLLAKPGSADDLARKIIELLTSRAERERRGRIGRERAGAIYNWETTARNIEKAYFKAVSGKQR